MELPKMILPEQVDAAKVELDEEDHEDLIYDCHDLLSKVLARENPKWLQQAGEKLLARLEETLQWHKLH